MALVVASCGRIDFDPVVAPSDALGCPRIVLPPPPSAPFGAPQPVTALNSTDSEDDPTLSADELEIVFQSTRGGTSRLWRSVRGSKNEAWPSPTPIVELDGFAANTPEISRDGLRLRFAAPGPAGGEDLYLTTRLDRASAWQSPVHLEALATPQGETGAAEFLDGLALVFFSNRPGGAPNGGLWEVVDARCAGLAAATPLTSIGGAANAWMRNDGLVVMYSAAGATGGGDLHVASRAGIGEPFGMAAELTTLTSASVDDDPWVNDAMDAIYFVSARTGDVNLYHATR